MTPLDQSTFYGQILTVNLKNNMVFGFKRSLLTSPSSFFYFHSTEILHSHRTVTSCLAIDRFSIVVTAVDSACII